MLFQVEPEVLAAGIGFLVIAVDMARKYRADENIRLYQLPWLEFRSLFEFGRRLIFTVDRPDDPVVTTDKSVDEIKEILGKQGVKWRHRFSYRYEGEVLNGYVYFYNPEKEYPHRMIHPRVFDMGAYREIQAHTEPHWYHHPVAHLKSKYMRFDGAVEWVRERLDDPKHVGYPSD